MRVCTQRGRMKRIIETNEGGKDKKSWGSKNSKVRIEERRERHAKGMKKFPKYS